jgi:hypothetical protein
MPRKPLSDPTRKSVQKQSDQRKAEEAQRRDRELAECDERLLVELGVAGAVSIPMNRRRTNQGITVASNRPR